MRLHSPLNAISAVASGQTAQAPIPKNRRIHAIFLTSGSDNAAALGNKIREIRLMLGTVQLWRLTPAQLIALNAYRGIAFANGSLELYFSDPTARTPVGEEATAFNTFGLVGDLILEVEYKTDAEYNAATSTSDGFTPTLSGLLEYDFVNDTNRAFVTRKPVTIPNSSAGEVDFNTLPRTGAYKALHLFTSLVTRVRVKRDGVEIMDRTSAQITTIGRRNSLTPQSGHLPIDFAFTNQATDALEMIVFESDGNGGTKARPVNEFNIKLDASAGGNITGVVEQVVTV
jgi:hypothetical protein